MNEAGIRSATAPGAHTGATNQDASHVDRINHKLRHVTEAVKALGNQLAPYNLISTGSLPTVDMNVLANVLLGLKDQNLPALADSGTVIAELVTTRNGNNKMRLQFHPPQGSQDNAQALIYEINPKRNNQGLVRRHTLFGRVTGKEFYRGPEASNPRQNARLKTRQAHHFQHYDVQKATYELNPRSGQLEMLKARVILPDGTLEEGTFETDTQTGITLLFKGTRTLPSGQIQSGNFTRNRHLNIATLYFGEVLTRSATDQSRMAGIFSTDIFNNPHLSDGQVFDLDGNLKSDGKHTYLPNYGKNFLKLGKQIWPDGSVTRGEHQVFSDHNGQPCHKLVDGKKFGPDGQIEMAGRWTYANTLNGELALTSFTPRSVFSGSQLANIQTKIDDLAQLAMEMRQHPNITRQIDAGLLDQVSSLFNNASLALNVTDLENRLNLVRARVKTICTKMTLITHPDHTPGISNEDSQHFRQSTKTLRESLLEALESLNKLGQTGLLFYSNPQLTA